MKQLLLLITLICATSALNASNITIHDVKHPIAYVGTFDAYTIIYTKERSKSVRVFMEPIASSLIFAISANNRECNIKVNILGDKHFPELSKNHLRNYESAIGRTIGYNIKSLSLPGFLDLQITFGQETFYVRLKIKDQKIVMALEITKEQVGQCGEEEYDSADTEPFEYIEYGKEGTSSDDDEHNIDTEPCEYKQYRNLGTASDDEDSDTDSNLTNGVKLHAPIIRNEVHSFEDDMESQMPLRKKANSLDGASKVETSA